MLHLIWEWTLERFSAYNVVNEYTEEELAKIIKDYGEDNWAKRIAKFIVEGRAEKPIETTGELVDIIKKAIPKKARIDTYIQQREHSRL